MKADALKLELIQWLAGINDKSILESLSLYKKNVEKLDWWDNLNSTQLKKVEKGIQNGKEGKIKSSKEVWKKYGRKSKN